MKLNIELLIATDTEQVLVGGFRLLRSDGVCLGSVGSVMLTKGPLLTTTLEYFSEIGVVVSIPATIRLEKSKKGIVKNADRPKHSVKVVVKKKA